MTDKDKTDQVEPQANQQVQDEALEGVAGAGLKMPDILKKAGKRTDEPSPDNEHGFFPALQKQNW